MIGQAGAGLAEVGTDIFAHIILSIIAIAVMWMGVKAAVSYDEVTQKAFAPFAKLGDSVGNFVQNIPSYLPTPHPAFAALTPGGATAIGSGLDKTVLDRQNYNKQKSLAETMGTTGTKQFEGATANLNGSAQNLNKAVDVFESLQN